MDRDRRTALWAGLWFIGTFVFSIPALFIYGSILNDQNYVVGAGADARVHLGGLFEILTGVAGIATAVVLYRIVRRVSESIALGYVALRIVETLIIIIGVISLLSVVTMRKNFAATAGADPALYLGIGKALLAIHDWTFIIGPAFCAVIGNGIMLGYLLYRGQLVPRRWAMFGMVAGAIGLVSALAQLFNIWENGSTASALFIVPEIIWEAFVGIYLTFKGFTPSPVLPDEPVSLTDDAASAR